MLQGFYKNQIHTPNTQTYLCSQLWFLIHVLEWKPLKEEYFKSQMQGSQAKSEQVQLKWTFYNSCSLCVVVFVCWTKTANSWWSTQVCQGMILWCEWLPDQSRQIRVWWFFISRGGGGVIPVMIRSRLIRRAEFNLTELWPLKERNSPFYSQFQRGRDWPLGQEVQYTDYYYYWFQFILFWFLCWKKTSSKIRGHYDPNWVGHTENTTMSSVFHNLSNKSKARFYNTNRLCKDSFYYWPVWNKVYRHAHGSVRLYLVTVLHWAKCWYATMLTVTMLGILIIRIKLNRELNINR